jgi:hypothetical protein
MVFVLYTSRQEKFCIVRDTFKMSHPSGEAMSTAVHVSAACSLFRFKDVVSAEPLLPLCVPSLHSSQDRPADRQ